MPSSLDSPGPRTSKHDRQHLPGAFPLSSPISPGFNAQRHLAREVLERKDEYIKTKKLRIKIGSWNVASCPGTEKDIEGWFIAGKGVSKRHGGLPTGSKLEEDAEESAGTQEERFTKDKSSIPTEDTSQLPGDSEIDVYVLGLQEIIDINSAAEALRPYNDPAPANKWKDAVGNALPDDYVLIAEQQLLGLYLLIYASSSIASTVSSVSTASVGTGLMGYMGNKGGVSARIVLGETTKLVFVNCHLAAGNDKASLERRNWDSSQIIQRTRFAPIDHGYGVVDELGDYIGEEDFAFWFGDMNYRLADIPGSDVRRLLLLHTRNEYAKDDATRQLIDKELNIKEEVKQSQKDDPPGVLAPSEDPASALTTIKSLLMHDQLHSQMRMRNAFHEGWQEGPIHFLPTYKYDIGSVGMFDSSEKKRSPSWCDRILYRTKRHYQEWLQEKNDLDKAKQRDLEMKARGLEKENGEEIIFDYDPEIDGDDGPEANTTDTQEELDDSQMLQQMSANSSCKVDLEYYVSHQKVLSSDHKPLDAIFTIEYKAVDAELKGKVHQEVAKEIDRQENEGRPSVTAIFESSDLHEESDGCQFGELQFFQEKVVLLTVANTSPAPASFQFMNQHGNEEISTWFRVSGDHNSEERSKPLSAMTLQSGDSVNLEAVAMVSTADDLDAFNTRKAQPEDVLIMRVQKGRDHFIPIQAKWLRSCFGMTIEQLIRLGKNCVRDQSLEEEMGHEEVKGSAPRELFRLTEALEEAISDLTTEKNFLDILATKPSDWPFTVGSMEDMARNTHALALRDALDTGSPFDFQDLGYYGRAELLGRTMVMFLSFMPGRLISCSLWNTLSASIVEREKAKGSVQGDDFRTHILDILSSSPPASVSFTFITFMLARMLKESAPLGESKLEPTQPQTPLSPRAPEALLRLTKGLSLRADGHTDRRAQMSSAFVERFVPLIFEAETTAKTKKVETERKKLVLSAFLQD